VLEAAERTLGRDHSLTVSAAMGLSTALTEQGRWAEAEPLARIVLEHRKKQFGAESPAALASMNNLARTLKALGNFQEAEALYRQALKGVSRIQGPSHANTLGCTTNLALLLVECGRADEAEELLRPAVELASEAYGPGHPVTLDTRIGLGRTLIASGDFDDAEKILGQGLDDATAAGTTDSLIQSARYFRGVALEKAQRPQEALIMYRQAYDGLNKPHGLRADFADRVISGMLSCLTSLQQFEPAEQLLMDIQKQFEAIDSPSSKLMYRLNERFADLYTAWDRPAQAAAYRLEAERLMCTTNPATNMAPPGGP
jgi:tetratricopeptide (TPR) repeat protein